MWQGGHAWQRGVYGKGACMTGGVCMAGGVRGGEACMAGGHAWQGGMHGKGACVSGGMHAMHAPWTPRDMVGQCTGGTHPTGMHSCILWSFNKIYALLGWLGSYAFDWSAMLCIGDTYMMVQGYLLCILAIKHADMNLGQEML